MNAAEEDDVRGYQQNSNEQDNKKEREMSITQRNKIHEPQEEEAEKMEETRSQKSSGEKKRVGGDDGVVGRRSLSRRPSPSFPILLPLAFFSSACLNFPLLPLLITARNPSVMLTRNLQ